MWVDDFHANGDYHRRSMDVDGIVDVTNLWSKHPPGDHHGGERCRAELLEMYRVA